MIIKKSFKKWCIENKAYELLKLYENADNEYRSDEIPSSTSKVVNWKCNTCNMLWQQSLNSITSKRKTDKTCPYCSHKRPSPFYNFATEFPPLAQEWDYELNSKSPTEYTPHSAEKVYWKCQNNHRWQNVIKFRTRYFDKHMSSGQPLCPYCNHRRVSTTYNLVVEFPNIAKQWDYIKNGSLTPLEVSPKSHLKVWWKCEYNPNHSWQCSIANRTLLGRGCPICSKTFSISFPSRALYYYLKPYFHDCEMEYRIFGTYTLDLYIPSYKIIIEYDGYYYHSDEQSKKRQNKKDNIFKSNGLYVLHIKELTKETNDITYENNVIKYYPQEARRNLNNLIEKVLSVIGEKTHTKINPNIDFKRDYQKIEDLYYHTRKSNSLAVKCPELAKQWHPTKNIMSPDTINTGNNYKAFWICPKCHKEYQATVNNRAKHKSNCPFCYNRQARPYNLLSYHSPEISKEWNYKKNNNLTPDQVTYSSKKKVWWICKNGHEWEQRIDSRARYQNSQCPICKQKALLEKNSFAVKYPELCSLWNEQKNAGQTPYDFSYASNKVVWWKCDKNHEWQMSFNHMKNIKSEQKCPYCRKDNQSPKSD